MSVEATLGLGGNLGDPVAAFAAALARLRAHAAVELKAASSVWRTAPWGKLDQPEFRNMAVLIETSVSADDLLALCLSIERESGRERRERWGPRTLDIDILTYGGQTIERPGLQVPHPRIAERAFVLAPLAEIAPTITIGARSIAALLAAIASQDVSRDADGSQRLKDMLAARPG
ncbi:2-amino-4-hydroxy-6-hydroxymethyldihydropteridine diphosphokinase [Bosea vestrisii]|uniref:2-amino-4-hydroxy-6- hydroxymethyldihydropteridine diphosphokinase n=1 Tax=Bosea vestrisii TaxID=151416 RepID=UPI0024DFF2F0|nr:2-amino-4-hydroxy-6-hydroxymethyldihydropteridine diphosphokinase [Bosea vestrisii]WID98898.1 2-amino-4-hydroxy-6-hydroxymethyldihydropteridine diphosphokinase [Bosea vestrisii]